MEMMLDVVMGVLDKEVDNVVDKVTWWIKLDNNWGKWMNMDNDGGDGWKCMEMDDVGWNRCKWMKMNENGWKSMMDDDKLALIMDYGRWND